MSKNITTALLSTRKRVRAQHKHYVIMFMSKSFSLDSNSYGSAFANEPGYVAIENQVLHAIFRRKINPTVNETNFKCKITWRLSNFITILPSPKSTLVNYCEMQN